MNQGGGRGGGRWAVEARGGMWGYLELEKYPKVLKYWDT